MKNLFRFTILFAVLFSLSACGSPKADIEVVFTKDNCEYNGPNGAVDSPVTVHVVNKTNPDENVTLGVGDEYGLAFVTLKEGFTKADIEAYQEYGNPPFVDRMVGLVDPIGGEEKTMEVELDPGREHFVVCARQSGVISVPAVITPK